MTSNQIIIDGEHDMNYCEDNNCKHYGNKEQCEKTHCYYRCYSKLYTKLKAKEQELETICKAFDIEYAIDEETGSLIGRSNKLQEKEQELEEAKVKNVAYEAAAKDMRDHIKFIDETNRILYDEKVELLNKLERLENEYEGFAVKYTDMEIALHDKEQECERLKQGYAELTEIVSPYMGDFTGYNKELGGFDIVLCVKELMEQLDQLKAENKELKAAHDTNISLADKLFKLEAALKQIQKQFGIEILYCKVTGESTFRSTEILKLKHTLEEIKEIVQFSNRPYKLCGEYNNCCDVLNEIWNKISEVDDESYLDNHWLFTENKKGEN